MAYKDYMNQYHVKMSHLMSELYQYQYQPILLSHSNPLCLLHISSTTEIKLAYIYYEAYMHYYLDENNPNWIVSYLGSIIY